MNAPTTVSEREGMSLADFLATDENIEIINGKVIKRPRHMVASRSLLIRAFIRQLDVFTSQEGRFEVFSQMTFVISGTYAAKWVTRSYVPDVLVIQHKRYLDWMETNPNHHNQVLEVIPDLVIEIVSENDRYHTIMEKVETYLVDGVKLIWLVDPQAKRVTIYSAERDYPITLKGEGVLTGEDVLPGFSLALKDLFA